MIFFFILISSISRKKRKIIKKAKFLYRWIFFILKDYDVRGTEKPNKKKIKKSDIWLYFKNLSEIPHTWLIQEKYPNSRHEI